MPTTRKSAVQKYLHSRHPAGGIRAEYQTTLAKWKSWGGGVPIERLGRKVFLDWVYDRAVAGEGTNPGSTANQARAPATEVTGRHPHGWWTRTNSPT